MTQKTVVLLLGMLAAGGLAHGQDTGLPPAPVPVAPTDNLTIPPPRPLPASHRVVYPPPSPPPAPHPTTIVDNPGIWTSAVCGYAPPAGWFGAFEADLVKPHIKNRLRARVPIEDLFVARIQLPTADLDWTVAPRFELGYRLPDEGGEFLVAYRFLLTEGWSHGAVREDDIRSRTGLHSRLDLNVIDLDYAQREYGLGPDWDVKWRIGARMANVFFDSRSNIGFNIPGDDITLIDSRRTSNYFFGAGPHLGLDVGRRLGDSGLSLLTRVEGALVVGRISQGFEEVFAFSDGFAFGGARSVAETQAVPVLNVQLGLSWSAPGDPWKRYSLGYQYEHWWQLGDAGGSRAELWDQGVFFRVEYKY